MLQFVDVDMMRATARFQPGGMPTDTAESHERAFKQQRAVKRRSQAVGHWHSLAGLALTFLAFWARSKSRQSQEG